MPRPLREWIKRLGRFSLDYIDLLIAAALALYISYNGIRDEFDAEELTQATVALLGVLAVVIFRERWERAKAVANVDRALAVATAVKPWRILDAKHSWELKSIDGARATATAIKELRIEQDDVYSIYEWHQTPVGTVTRHECVGREKGAGTDRKFPIIYEDLPVRGGKTYRVISLEGLYRRGQCLIYRSERDLQDFFTDPRRENVSVNVEIPTDRITMSVTWPRDGKPSRVEFDRTGHATAVVETADLKRAGNGRVKHLVSVSDPAVGDKITITWNP